MLHLTGSSLHNHKWTNRDKKKNLAPYIRRVASWEVRSTGIRSLVSHNISSLGPLKRTRRMKGKTPLSDCRTPEVHMYNSITFAAFPTGEVINRRWASIIMISNVGIGILCDGINRGLGLGPYLCVVVHVRHAGDVKIDYSRRIRIHISLLVLYNRWWPSAVLSNLKRGSDHWYDTGRTKRYWHGLFYISLIIIIEMNRGTKILLW